MANRTINPKMHYVTAYYDFEKDGGAINTGNGVVPSISSEIPVGAIIMEAVAKCDLQPTAGGNMQIRVGALQLSTAKDRAHFTTGAIEGGASLPKIVATAASVSLHGTAALTTAGRFAVTVGYITS